MKKIYLTVFFMGLLIGWFNRPAAGYTIEQLLDAINQVEASGQKDHVPRGDSGNAIGGLQVHQNYWIDSRVEGTWEMCEGYTYSVRVAKAYFKRYEPDATDPRTLAMLHHYGPGWRGKNTDPDGYWGKVQSHLPKGSHEQVEI